MLILQASTSTCAVILKLLSRYCTLPLSDILHGHVLRVRLFFLHLIHQIIISRCS